MVRGEDVRAERESLSMTQETLSALSGVHIATLSRWERGLGKPSFGAQRQVQGVLHCAQMLRQQFDVPIDFNNREFMRDVVARFNQGRRPEERENAEHQVCAAGEAAEAASVA